MELLLVPITEMAAEQKAILRQNIDALFGETEHEIYFYLEKKKEVIDIIYTDFLPKSKVKDLISEYLPSSFHLKLHRKYSYQVIAEEFYSLFCKNDVAILECIDGELMARSIRQFINDRLKELSFYK